MDDLLYTMPVDADGKPSGPAVKLNDETTDAPTWSGDSSKILYLNNGKLKLDLTRNQEPSRRSPST